MMNNCAILHVGYNLFPAFGVHLFGKNGMGLQVRHGQSTWNAEGRMQGSSNFSQLTEKVRTVITKFSSFFFFNYFWKVTCDIILGCRVGARRKIQKKWCIGASIYLC